MKLPAGLSYEGKLEHVIEQIVLSMSAAEGMSTADIRASIRECSKRILRLYELEIPNDVVIDGIARELVEWHAPRPDEEGWNPDLADAPAEQRLMAANRNLVDAALAELEHEIALHEAERAETARQDKFQRVREDAERRRQRGDHEGADFLEQWIDRQMAKEPLP